VDYNNNYWTNAAPKPIGIRVPPLNIEKVRLMAEAARQLFQVEQPKVDVIDLYEVRLHELGVVYEYCDEDELKTEAGLTLPNDGKIKIREDVYNGAHDGNGFHRFTMCHEVGHLLLHGNVALPRATGQHKWIEDSEWQANTFAAEFMMPVEHLLQLCHSPNDVMAVFGVSREAANMRWRKLQEQGIIRTDRAVTSRPIQGFNR
jgi:hypothetical protein